MELPVPFAIPEEARFEHCHIVGGTGHGKTQLMQRMIHGDLVAAQRAKRSVVVVDSQGDLINRLVRLGLFSPDAEDSLADRLIVIDPADVEFPAALNLFDAHLDRLREYRPVDRERVLNGVVELYETFFGALLGAELTQKQGVIFKYLARLMITIPGATIHTLMELMEDGKPFKKHMDELEGSARYFFETEFFHPSFAATKKQILRRLWGVLSTPAFERMFAQPANKLDLFQAMQDGKIILINTAKDLLKQEGSQLFGRFFIAMLAQAALERSTVPLEDRTPTLVYVDEAQEYFDDNTETILNQARKYRVGLTVAHQTLDQLSPRLRSILHSNTSMKCAGGVSAKDARAFADELHTSADFIESMKRRPGKTEFAVWIKHQTPQAIRLAVPLGFLERQPLLTEEEYEALLARNRLAYCGTLADAARAQPKRSPPEEPAAEASPRAERPRAPPQEEPAVRPAPPPSDEPQADPSPDRAEESADGREAASESSEPNRPSHDARPPPPPRAKPTESGKGGSQHRYVQHLVKRLAEDQGFRAVIEEPVSGGQVDVGLHRGDLSIACEISITSTTDYEAQNLAKCLRAGFTFVWAIAPDQKRQRALRRAAEARLSTDEMEKIQFLTPDEVVLSLEQLATPEPEENTVLGYKVKVTRKVVSPEEAKRRRENIARIVAGAVRPDADR
nr:type IV secretion system DNA-binding domain-containing protein [Phenylobacterium aquaticum]